MIGAAFGELFGAKSGPEVSILKKLQNIWPSLYLKDLILPDIPPYLDEKSEKVLSFIEKRLADLQYLLVVTAGSYGNSARFVIKY